jgi:hypothetical protein
MMRSHHCNVTAAMRTTLDIDDDILLAAKEHAARERKSLGAVISALARESLRRPQAPAGKARSGRATRAGGRFAVLPWRAAWGRR